MPEFAYESADESADERDPESAVSVRDLWVTRGGRDILRGVSCDLPAGRCTALLGPNGCGKTTLARCLTGHALFRSGAVRVLGRRIGRTDVRALRRRVAVVHPATDAASAHVSGAVVDADLTAAQAVQTGLFGTVGLYERPTPEQTERCRGLLRAVGLIEQVDQRFATLSSGQQRRCLIARALALGPELLILDEPTAGLDLAGREQVLATIEGLLSHPKPPTVLMITHHVEELSPRTVQVLLMKRGRITSAGRPEAVITPETLSPLFDCKVFVRRLHGRYWLEVLPEAWLELMRQPPAQSEPGPIEGGS